MVLCARYLPQVDAGDVLDEALRALPDIRSLILPLGFAEVDVRAFRSGGVSGGNTVEEGTENLGGVLKSGGRGVDVYRVEGTGRMSLS